MKLIHLGFAVSNSTQVLDTLTEVVQNFGKIDVFVANAGKLTRVYRHDMVQPTDPQQGMSISKPILEQTLDEYRKMMSVNGTD